MIGNLDRNDMSFVPATTVKNGRTLSLSNVEWQVTGTALVGEALVPSQYQAVATYSAPTSWKAATGYVTTAEYRGEVVSEGIESVTYTVVYTGEPIKVVEPERHSSFLSSTVFSSPLFSVGVFMMLALLIGLAVLLFMRRRNVYIYVPSVRARDYKLVAKYRVELERPEIDISDLDLASSHTVAVEIKRSLAKKLIGKTFSVRYEGGVHTYEIDQDGHDDWHEFEFKEETLCGED